MHRRFVLCTPLALAATPVCGPAHARSSGLDVVYPALGERPRQGYGYRILELALQHCGEPFTLRLSTESAGPARARMRLEEGDISVYDFGVSPEADQRFSPIHFPIDLGLSGYRRLVVRRDRADKLGAVRTLEQLRLYTAGQGLGWADIRILENVGVRVYANTFSALMRMLEGGRFDCLPLGIEEADDLLAANRALAPNCVVLPSPVLRYPFARQFYVSRRQPRLRDALQRGLEKAHGEGAVRRLLQQLPSFAPLIGPKAPAVGPVIELPNPWLSEAFRAMPARWFVDLSKRA